jgi:hypothetical protein
MTRLNKPADPVIPSAPDPVDAWLDVLVAMLSIPKADRQRVRDELEDHLRSRIDDLLIHGLTEPQALQKAVAELGETADLARQLSHAHKPPRTRRYAMHALIIALAGTVVALGVNTMRPQAGLPATSSLTVTEESTPDTSSVEPIPVRDQSLGQILAAFQERSDRPVMIHWPLLAEIGFDRETALDLDSEPLRPDLILRLLAERTEPTLRNSIAVLEGPDLIEIGLRSQFDQRTMQRKSYDASMLMGYGAASPASRERIQNPSMAQRGASFSVSEGARGVALLLETHISPLDWVNKGGDLAQYSIMGTTIVVTAPERIQQSIASLIEELAKNQNQAEEAGREAARLELEALQANFDELDSEYNRLFAEWESLTMGTSPDSNAPLRTEVNEFRRRDLMERMQIVRIRQSSITSAKDQIVREWGLRPDSLGSAVAPRTSIDQPDASDFVRFFPLDSMTPIWVPVSQPSGLKLSQLLVGQGFSGEELQTLHVYIQPAGMPDSEFVRTTVQSVLTKPGSDRELGAGDRVQVTTRVPATTPSRRAP